MHLSPNPSIRALEKVATVDGLGLLGLVPSASLKLCGGLGTDLAQSEKHSLVAGKPSFWTKELEVEDGE